MIKNMVLLRVSCYFLFLASKILALGPGKIKSIGTDIYHPVKLPYTLQM